jgi:hypothetical protein
MLNRNRSWHLLSLALLALVAAPSLMGQSPSPVIATTSENEISILKQIEIPGTTLALAISLDGQRAAYAIPAERSGSVEIVEHGSDGQRRLTTVEGTVRDLLYLPDHTTLIGAHHRPLKRREGDTFLIAWPLNESKPTRILRLPTSSQDLELWPAENAILVACTNELRTILLPDYRSGKLFSVPGNNLTVTAMGTGQHVALGSDQGVSLYDLSRPSGRESMPVVSQQATDSPVIAITDLADARSAWLLQQDRTLIQVSFDPPGMQPLGKADWLVRTTVRDQVAALPTTIAMIAEERAEIAKQRRPPEPAQALELTPDPEPKKEVPRPAQESPSPQPIVVAEESQPVKLAEEPVKEQTPPPAQAPSGPTVDAQLFGQLIGNHALAKQVVLWGPNNIMREAERVEIVDGFWFVNGLTPGRYRLQVDGGGSSMLVTEPRFLIIEVTDTPQRAAVINVQKTF